MSEDAKLLNPDIREIVYGKKELSKLTLYPLSVGDQFKVTDLVTEVIQNVVKGQEQGLLNDFTFTTTILKAIEKNISKILSIIADISEEESENIISKLTNTQLTDIIESVWEVDYEPMLKKGKSLLERGKSVFSSRKSSQTSSNATLNTGSKTSTEKATDQGVLDFPNS